ncbi:nucleotide binding protein, PINc [Vulcanisaeta distributa DSM 14429]|uniref:Nucleotide binding protein, PINc n=2 Tax=Vulcanisaeta distributa TaxID=164451 RepID=E1QNE4_VULDI|nr:nucleotide binding protein, PINc [Vulcanisaeta distributa DSM 14429]
MRFSSEVMRDMKIECVVFDTSAILLMFTEGLRVIDQVIELVNSPIIPIIPHPILNELIKLSMLGRPGISKASSNAVNYVISNFSIANAVGSPDDSVVEVSSKYGCVAVTCDMKLLRRLRRMYVRTIYLRASAGKLEADFDF